MSCTVCFVTDLPVEDARALVRAIVELAGMADRALPRRSSPLAARLQKHLGVIGEAIASTSLSLPIIERVNVQLALDAYEADVERWEMIDRRSRQLRRGVASGDGVGILARAGGISTAVRRG